MAQESTMSLAVVDAHEHRDIVTSDAPNTLIQTVLECHDGDDRVMMKITGVLVDILLADDPDLCGGHVTCESGKKVPCVVVLKAICGMLISALLWCRKFRVDLEANGLALNPHDACASNKVVNKKQHTVRFHVDDVMSSHVDTKVNDDFKKWPNKVHGEHGKVKST